MDDTIAFRREWNTALKMTAIHAMTISFLSRDLTELAFFAIVLASLLLFKRIAP